MQKAWQPFYVFCGVARAAESIDANQKPRILGSSHMHCKYILHKACTVLSNTLCGHRMLRNRSFIIFNLVRCVCAVAN